MQRFEPFRKRFAPLARIMFRTPRSLLSRGKPAALGTITSVLLMVLPCNGHSARAEQPNVLFIAVDDLNDWAGCLGGHPQTKSPNIDRLARQGVLFTRAYCAAPACNPSRTALMTGVRPHRSGVYSNPQPWRESPLLKQIVTLPQQFMLHGYEAVGAGKIYHGRYDDDASWNDYLKRGTDPKPRESVRKDPHSRAGGIVFGHLEADDSEMADYRTAQYAIDYLQQPHDKPFFLACGIFRPHMPWQVPRKYYELYPLSEIQLPQVPDNDLDDIPPAGIRMARPKKDHAVILATDNWPYAVQAYLASITFADHQIGRVLNALEASLYRNNTIVILWSDHGWHLGEKKHWRKFALWEEATRAPLIVVAPGITPADAKCHRTVDFLNIYPTLCELCGIPLPDHLDGVSMLPLLKNPQAEWNHLALTTHGRGNHAVRSERYRYIRYADGGEELYDHQTDPNEWTNLADLPEYLDVKQRLGKVIPRMEAEEAPYDPRLVPSKSKARNQRRKKRTKPIP